VAADNGLTTRPLIGAVRALATDPAQWLPLVGHVDLIRSDVFGSRDRPQVVQTVMLHSETLQALRQALPAEVTDPELAAMLFVVLTRQLRTV